MLREKHLIHPGHPLTLLYAVLGRWHPRDGHHQVTCPSLAGSSLLCSHPILLHLVDLRHSAKCWSRREPWARDCTCLLQSARYHRLDVIECLSRREEMCCGKAQRQGPHGGLGAIQGRGSKLGFQSASPIPSYVIEGKAHLTSLTLSFLCY